MTKPDFSSVTEIGGGKASNEQVDRTCHRYHWAACEVAGLDTVEVACGSGLGLGVLLERAKSLRAGDISDVLLAEARHTFADSVELANIDVERLSYSDGIVDAMIFFEALYYVDAVRFLAEARRVLRSGGKLLMATANCELPDFNPSPFSKKYFGSAELAQLTTAAGFNVEMFGYLDVRDVPTRQKILRPVKKLAVVMNLMPKTMKGKEALKKIFFGKIATMPADLRAIDFRYVPPVPLPLGVVDKVHKVIYCKAIKCD